MHSTRSLIHQLEAEYPQFNFTEGDDFHWSHGDQTITYLSTGTAADLLHELGHALSGHAEYRRDIELVTMEREAWTRAQQLAERYEVTIAEDTIQEALDTYRDWLHARSTCPTCKATGIEVKKHHYRCVACRSEWQVNEARLCGLRRQTLK